MSRDQRVARAINARKAKPIPPPRPTPASVQTDLDTIDAATNDPTIHAATARIRAALPTPADTGATTHTKVAEYYVQSRPYGGTWEDGPASTDPAETLTWLNGRKAAQPSWEHRLANRTRTIESGPSPDQPTA
ncbi:hypothetical protein E6R18_25285 [Streptomyces sp. A1277]|uniref:hypothetical protein n=1 Tax=Streptomyces sp. A1277 TaxID=2563103 RepID=UPI0010A2A60D|nr:hypothetical protein [Streptomyces sp. A1277]THA29222.1 hypothetical protein E6R18_25285 [Streptomyces sp. A1277]